jgi:hypothetical protein
VTIELAEFTRLVEAYGADPKRWPGERRTDALALVQSDPAAAAILDDARSLDEILDTAPNQAPSLVLRTAVAAAALGGGRRRTGRSDQARSAGRPMPRRLAAAAAIAAACAAGAVTGVAAATRQVLPVRAVVSADPAVDAGRLLAEPLDAEG